MIVLAPVRLYASLSPSKTESPELCTALKKLHKPYDASKRKSCLRLAGSAKMPMPIRGAIIAEGGALTREQLAALWVCQTGRYYRGRNNYQYYFGGSLL